VASPALVSPPICEIYRKEGLRGRRAAVPTVQSSVRKRWGRGAGRANRGKSLAITGKKMALPGGPSKAKGEAKTVLGLNALPKP